MQEVTRIGAKFSMPDNHPMLKQRSHNNNGRRNSIKHNHINRSDNHSSSSGGQGQGDDGGADA